MSLSVIIPTYNRLYDVMRCLKNLQEQIIDKYEIILVDNAVDNELYKIVQKLTTRIKVQYIPERCLGLHNARHAGARAANGDILVFTDDDATFDPGWLQAYATAFAENPEMAAAGGPVRPKWATPPPQWLLDFMGDSKTFGYLSLMEPYQAFRLDPKGVFLGVNMAIRREVLFEVGGFNPEAFGDVWLGDGESGLNRKLCERGMLIGYVPEAVVYHHIPPERMTVEYLCRRMANEGACTEYATFHKEIPGPVGIWVRIIRIVLSSVKLGFTTLGRIILCRDRLALLRARMGFAYRLSRIRYVHRMLHDQALRELVEREHWLTK